MSSSLKSPAGSVRNAQQDSWRSGFDLWFFLHKQDVEAAHRDLKRLDARVGCLYRAVYFHAHQLHVDLRTSQ